MIKQFYTELDIFCILIILILFLRVHKNVDKQNSQRILEGFMIAVMAFFASDMLWILADHAFPMEWIWLNYAINMSYYILSMLVSFLWFWYSESQQESRLVASRKKRLLCAAPMLFVVLLCFTTPWTHLMFTVDDAGSFHRDMLGFLQASVGIGYAMFTSVKAFAKAQNKKNFVNKNRYVTLSSFGIFPAFFGILQVYVTDTPVLSMGLTLALLQIYINLQYQLISVDPLTQLNNRNQLIRFLSGKMKSSSANKTLYLLMMDMDYFKKINDQFGHIEGDRALVTVANVLKRVCARYNGFVCRYGGDEFIIVCEMQNEEHVKQLCTELNEVLAEENRITNPAYVLHLSIGYAAHRKDIQTIPDFIQEADKMLYEIKKARKAPVSP